MAMATSDDGAGDESVFHRRLRSVGVRQSCRAGGEALTVADLIERAQRESPGLVTTLGPPDEALIGAAEERLGLAFPEPYRQFVTEFGAMEIGGRPIFGIGSSLGTVDGLNVVWHTEQARANRDLSRNELVLSAWDDLTLEVMEIVGGDGPVRERLVEGPGEDLASSFLEWLARTIREAREDAGE
jgi:hypothetical protein